MVKNWAKKTPHNFKFTAKFPKVITHDKHLVDVDEVSTFLNNIEPLQEKTRPSIQLPPSLQIIQGLVGLKELVRRLDDRFRYAVEVRHPSWFQDLAYNFFANNGNRNVRQDKLETLHKRHQRLSENDKVVSWNHGFEIRGLRE